jgi:hypothetical protein
LLLTTSTAPQSVPTNQYIPNTNIVEAASTSAIADIGTTTDTAALASPTSPNPLDVKTYVENYFAETPILAKIAGCESQFRQFTKDGQVLHGSIVYQDIGVMQINETYHKAEGEKLGFDMYTLDGNLAFAKYIYDHEGTQPWASSEACWGNE